MIKISVVTKSVLQKLRRFVFPPSCVLCQEILAPGEQYICKDCEAKTSYIKHPVCMKCGGEITEKEQALCEDCSRFDRHFVKGFPAMKYDYPIDEALAAFKYQNKRGYGEFFASEIFKVHGDAIQQLKVDVLVPIPIHQKKLLKRGYNQAELLADDLGKELGVPVDTELLKRTIHTPPQKKLDQHERELNMKKAFQSTDKIVNYKKVMLVDDIYTTGATVEACTKLLLDKGVKEVYYTSVAIGVGMR